MFYSNGQPYIHMVGSHSHSQSIDWLKVLLFVVELLLSPDEEKRETQEGGGPARREWHKRRLGSGWSILIANPTPSPDLTER